MTTYQPQSSAQATPTLAELPEDAAEHFAGYAVLGLPFSSGHYLAFRDFPVSSVGPGYRSVGHRTPGGEWTIYANTAPEFSCARYFGAAVQHTVETDVDIRWSGPFTALITVPGIVDWHLQLGTSPATSMLTAMAVRMPESLWRNELVLRAMGAFAGPLMNAGKMKVSGVVPNGQTFQAQPRQLWLVTGSQATIMGEDAGQPGPLEVQDHLADFWLPQRGLFGARVGVRFPSTAQPGNRESAGPRAGKKQAA
ncbi:hypothetical protein FBY30_0263 [Arthrobacter sp. SLBN-83]|uniref:hypothetical protein n=1 Tax=Arthrobacter sp. SLBN-83 TaxID=2768449 RepID=UPI001154420A|nr:hypothetical protein [Arthrobacter sp. SLBN-83]TQJ58053.1 hypothetical protein FBY30_0263 [Arthrobacter sp. SLBN-83]